MGKAAQGYITMKEIGKIFIAAIIGVFVLSGCATAGGIEPELPEPEVQPVDFRFSLEMFRISWEDFQSFPWPPEAIVEAESDTALFEAVVAAREAWMQYAVEHHVVGTDTSPNLYSMLTALGFSSEDAEYEITFLDSIGNNIFFFNYAHDDNYLLIMYCVRLPLPAITARIVWSTIQGNHVQNLLPMNAVKAEIMTLFDRYGFAAYNTEPFGRDDFIQREISALAQFRAIGSDLPEVAETIGWLRDTNNRNFAYQGEFNLPDEVMEAVTVTRGNAVYVFSFRNTQHPNLRDGFVERPTSQNRDLFESHLARIFSDSY